jgi:dephospho-CoA kinase
MEDKMKLIGLTGGIASGKTTVASILKRLGAEVLDADAIARKVVEPGEKAWEKIVEVFGKDILLPDKKINRKLLGDLIFANPEMRERLNTIVHPEVINIIQNKIEQIKKEDDDKVIVLDVPLPTTIAISSTKLPVKSPTTKSVISASILSETNTLVNLLAFHLKTTNIVPEAIINSF